LPKGKCDRNAPPCGAVEFRLAHKEAKAIGGDGAEESGGEGEQARGEGKFIGCLTELGIDEFERACGAAC
jgi:hypothetical protein